MHSHVHALHVLCSSRHVAADEDQDDEQEQAANLCLMTAVSVLVQLIIQYWLGKPHTTCDCCTVMQHTTTYHMLQ